MTLKLDRNEIRTWLGCPDSSDDFRLINIRRRFLGNSPTLEEVGQLDFLLHVMVQEKELRIETWGLSCNHGGFLVYKPEFYALRQAA